MEQWSNVVASTGVPIKPIQEEFVLHMEQLRLESVAASRDVPTLSLREGSVGSMAQRLRVNGAVLRDVTMVLLKEAFVSRMALRRNDAASTGVPINHRREESASHMELRWR